MAVSLDRGDNRGLHILSNLDTFASRNGDIWFLQLVTHNKKNLVEGRTDRIGGAFDLLKKAAHDGIDLRDMTLFDWATGNTAPLDSGRDRKGIGKEAAHGKEGESWEPHVWI